MRIITAFVTSIWRHGPLRYGQSRNTSFSSRKSRYKHSQWSQDPHPIIEGNIFSSSIISSFRFIITTILQNSSTTISLPYHLWLLHSIPNGRPYPIFIILFHYRILERREIVRVRYTKLEIGSTSDSYIALHSLVKIIINSYLFVLHVRTLHEV